MTVLQLCLCLCLCLETSPYSDSQTMDVASKVSPALGKNDSPSHLGLAGFSGWTSCLPAHRAGHTPQPSGNHSMPVGQAGQPRQADLFYSSCIVPLKNNSVPRIEFECSNSHWLGVLTTVLTILRNHSASISLPLKNQVLKCFLVSQL